MSYSSSDRVLERPDQPLTTCPLMSTTGKDFKGPSTTIVSVCIVLQGLRVPDVFLNSDDCLFLGGEEQPNILRLNWCIPTAEVSDRPEALF